MNKETHSSQETQQLGFEVAQEVLKHLCGDHATIFALQGELGSGKTTFAQGFAQGLGITEKVLSPTFLIIKSYPVPGTEKTLYHIDCYRIKDSHDLLELGWQEIVQNSLNIILLEWPARVQDALPEDAISIEFQTLSQTARQITIAG